MIGETIVNLILVYDRIQVAPEDSAAVRIDVLYREGQIDKDLCDILHILRKTRNKAIHENYSSVSEAKILLQMAYSLCEWFMQAYGDWSYEHHDFIMPEEKNEQKVTAIDSDDENRNEKILLQQAEKTAKASPAIPLDERKQRAMKAASQRQKTEAETRYLIDEQLRQVGWEADTENLRYSKGTRPEKGRDMAIAEWPTKSPDGKNGYADYVLFIGTKMVAIIEAKAEHKDVYDVIDHQGKEYPKNIRIDDSDYILGTWGPYKVPFTFATNGRPYLEQLKTKSGIWFLDLRNSSNVAKALQGWMGPIGIQELIEKDIDSGNQRLESMGYEVEEAEGGRLAVELYSANSPDLVTLDILMPEQDGLETLRQILKLNPAARVVMVTALGMEDYIKQAMELGASGFIIKPFAPEQVQAVVSKVLEEPAEG